MKIHTSLGLALALFAAAAPATAVEKEPSGKFSRVATGSTSFLGWTPLSLVTMLNSQNQRIVDLHVTSTNPLLFTGAAVTNSGVYSINSPWFYDKLASELAGLSNGGTRRPVTLTGYLSGGQVKYAMVMVDNTGANARATSTFADISLSSLTTFLNNNAVRLIDMSTWLDGSGNRHYSAITIANSGSDYIPIPAAPYAQFIENTPANVREYLRVAQANNKGARVIDVEPSSNGKVLAVLAYDGAKRNLATDSTAIPADSWFYPALTLDPGSLPEQSWNHAVLSTGGRVISVVPDVVGGVTKFDMALIQNQALPPISTLPVPNNDGSNQFGYLDNRVRTFMRQYDVTGAAIAIAKGNKLVYTRAFGYSDTELDGGTLAVPNTLFRVGSISKLITSVTLMQMVEDGALTPAGTPLTLDTHVFTDVIRPHLGITLQEEGAAAYSAADGGPGLESVTLRQVLSHSAGYEDNNCGLACAGNPLTSTVCVADQIDVNHTPSCDEIVSQWMVDKQLKYSPGYIGRYSNYGFCVAQAIVEGMVNGSYVGAVYNGIAFPAQLADPASGNWLIEPASDTYTAATLRARDYAFPWTGLAPSALVPQSPYWVDPPYGGVPVVNGLATGGWKASVTALVKMGVSINQSSPTGQIMGASTFESMFSPANTVWAWGVNDSCAENQTPFPSANGQFGLTFETQQGNGDLWKSGGIVGGGGFIVFRNLKNTYNAGTHSCADCITWAALVNTAGNGNPDGYDYDPPAGINMAMIDALNQATIQNAINNATVDLFPTYVGF